MKHIFEQKVFYADTDAYGVVWHGSYLRWLEMGRCEFCEMLGHDLVSLENQDIVLPVTNLNVRYKRSAKLNDEIIIETKIKEFNSIKVIFEQIIKDKKTGKTFIEADIDVVAISNAGKLHRRMPKILVEMFEKATQDKNKEEKVLEV